MVERSAVNRNVAGSSPARGANPFNDLKMLTASRRAAIFFDDELIAHILSLPET
jgi:hypothetical protein